MVKRPPFATQNTPFAHIPKSGFLFLSPQKFPAPRDEYAPNQTSRAKVCHQGLVHEPRAHFEVTERYANNTDITPAKKGIFDHFFLLL
jgi:hypothetical protein